MRVPDFIVRQLYVPGSLQREGDGFRLQARNIIGPGTLTGIGRISVDGSEIDLGSITAVRDGDTTVHRAVDVSPRTPIAFDHGDLVTLHVAAHPLEPGEHGFEVELSEVNAGTLRLRLSDRIG